MGLDDEAVQAKYCTRVSKNSSSKSNKSDFLILCLSLPKRQAGRNQSFVRLTL